jgi:hypothetical protein
MKSDTKILIGGIIATVAIIAGAVVFMGKDTSPKREQLGTAALTIDKKEEDFGSMKATDEKTATFQITNTSNTTLRIWNIVTSCDCTFASVVIGRETTGEFNMVMHTPAYLKNWIGEIPAKQTAKLLVTYRPKVMPVTGAVSRQVDFETNDPKNPTMEVSIKANVL